MVKLVCYDDREASPTKGNLVELHIGELNYCLVTIPPLVWNGFKGEGATPALVANCSTIPHRPDEIERLAAEKLNSGASLHHTYTPTDTRFRPVPACSNESMLIRGWRSDAGGILVDKDGAFAYVHGSAGLAWTAKANRQAFEKYKIIPRMLRDATVRDLSVCIPFKFDS